jgi:hypothetical protein
MIFWQGTDNSVYLSESMNLFAVISEYEGVPVHEV